jgi:hypothetical protein
VDDVEITRSEEDIVGRLSLEDAIYALKGRFAGDVRFGWTGRGLRRVGDQVERATAPCLTLRRQSLD